MPENPARNPVQGLAWRLLAGAESHPALIRRSDKSSRPTVERPARSFPAMALLSDPALDIRQYLEDLATIAVGSAHQAEDMLLEVRKGHRKTRRGIALVTSFGAIGLVVGAAGFSAGRNANIGFSEVRDELVALRSTGQDIASLQQQRKAEEAALARQEAVREALQQQIADLQRQARLLQDQVTRGTQDVEDAKAATSKRREDVQASSGSQHDEVALRSHNLSTAASEDGNARAQVEATRTDTERSRPPPGVLQQGMREKPAPAHQGAHTPQTAVLALRPQSTSPLIPASTVVRAIPVLIPEPSASQQLLIARQWLAAGRLDRARHVLAMAQTRMVLQPFEPDRAAARGVNALATNVGDAIRWLDMGSNEQAMQALDKALFNASSN